MCRAHRLTVVATAVLWGAVVSLIVYAPPEGGLHTLTILLGTLAVVMVPYCLFPWLLAGVLRAQLQDIVGEQLQDIAGAFLLGWKAEKDTPTEPARAPLTLIG